MNSAVAADHHFPCERRGMGEMGLLWPLLPPHSIMLTLPPVPISFLTCCPFSCRITSCLNALGPFAPLPIHHSLSHVPSPSPSIQDKKLSELPAYKTLLETFITKEIIPWGNFSQTYAAEILGQADIFGGTYPHSLPPSVCSRAFADLAYGSASLARSPAHSPAHSPGLTALSLLR